MRAMRRVTTIGSIAILAMATTVSSASATPWPWDGIYPDKSTHSYCYTTSVPDSIRSYIPGAMNYLVSATDIPGVPFQDPCDTKNSNEDGDPATDVAWFQAWVQDGYGDATTCKVRTASQPGWCDMRFVKINKAAVDAADDPHHQYIKTVCHELGHSLGLAHYDADGGLGGIPPGGEWDCMVSGHVTQPGAPPVSDPWIWQLNSHNKDHVNAWWP
ncbi:hypothetical protein IMZ11_25455 [Microtetraspora sp. AC03309]|uniref:hypothetical protein n=1 Tax=Microtetraspora sp. AC03309 TaxID=2779376 RepID=UPI001E43BB81|nr:hypothetical protein [Microtetraspora sp. AC03309]MCC5578978.1 hypothetical protein [Microtetraspora sp. AC03309]